MVFIMFQRLKNWLNTKQLNKTDDNTIKISKEEYQIFEGKFDKFIKENGELLKENKKLRKIKNKNIKQVETTYKETIEKLNQAYENIEKLDQQHIDQLKEIYEQFNKELQKYIAVNHLQNAALKQILELRFIDLIINKHEKIAKQNIKEIDPKPVYELVEKKEWLRKFMN